MYDNNNFTYNYDLKAELFEAQPLKKMQDIVVREYEMQKQDASFIMGIASLGISYTVATNLTVDVDIVKPYKYQLRVDGIDYKVLFIRRARTTLNALNNYKLAQFETIFYLG